MNNVETSDYKREGIFRVPASWAAIPNHPSESREPFYRFVIRNLVRMMRIQGMRIIVQGIDNVPPIGGALLASNHTGYYDFIFGGVAAELRGHRLVRFMAKKEIFEVPVVGTMMRAMKHISVDRSAGQAAFDEAVMQLRSGKLVGIFPEATISRSFEIKDLKNGAVRIAQQAEVPLLPMIIWGSQRVWTKGHSKKLGRHNFPIIISIGKPVDCSGTPEEATARLREVLTDILDEVRQEYEARFGPFPPGEFWMPASLGGSAPTLEQASKLDAEDQARNQAKKK